jgi:hypothetical protein
MGDERRLKAGWILACALAANAAVSCSKDDSEEQRRLLQTEERARQRQARSEARRIEGPQGELLPSDIKLGGVVMPRGFDPTFVDPHAWTYDGHFTQARVQEYFEKRLTVMRTTNKPLGEVEYLGVREKSNPNMPAALVRVSPTPSRPEYTRIYVGEPVPPPPAAARVVGDEALREYMAERRRTAR